MKFISNLATLWNMDKTHWRHLATNIFLVPKQVSYNKTIPCLSSFFSDIYFPLSYRPCICPILLSLCTRTRIGNAHWRWMWWRRFTSPQAYPHQMSCSTRLPDRLISTSNHADLGRSFITQMTDHSSKGTQVRIEKRESELHPLGHQSVARSLPGDSCSFHQTYALC